MVNLLLIVLMSVCSVGGSDHIDKLEHTTLRQPDEISMFNGTSLYNVPFCSIDEGINHQVLDIVQKCHSA